MEALIRPTFLFLGSPESFSYLAAEVSRLSNDSHFDAAFRHHRRNSTELTMALRVVSLCGYLCNVSIPWRKGAGGDHDAHDWILALKGKHFNGYAQVPVCGRLRRLTGENTSNAIQWFGELATTYLIENKIRGPFAIVPVPNSSSLVDSTAKPRTRSIP